MSTMRISSELDVDALVWRWEGDEAPRLRIPEVDEVVALPLWASEARGAGAALLLFASRLGSSSLSLCILSVKVSIPM
jgi:hypothetical protein